MNKHTYATRKTDLYFKLQLLGMLLITLDLGDKIEKDHEFE